MVQIRKSLRKTMKLKLRRKIRKPAFGMQSHHLLECLHMKVPSEVPIVAAL